MNIPFKQFKNDIPIVGQAVTVEDYSVTVQIKCNCRRPEDGQKTLMLVHDRMKKCPSCSRVFQWQGIEPGPNGHLQFVIGQIVDTNAANGNGQPTESRPS